MPTSAKCTLYDLVWDPHLRRVIHAVHTDATLHALRERLHAAGITTIDRAKAELHADSHYLEAIPEAERDLFLQTLEQANSQGK